MLLSALKLLENTKMLKPYLPDFILQSLGFISKYQILGIIPLNATLHILISSIITIVLIKKGIKPLNTFIFIFFLGLTKELFDSQALGNTWQKHVRDMCLNLIFPAMVLTVSYIKSKTNKAPSK